VQDTLCDAVSVSAGAGHPESDRRDEEDHENDSVDDDDNDDDGSGGMLLLPDGAQRRPGE